MSYPSIDPTGAVTVLTLRIPTSVAAQYDAIADMAGRVSGRQITRSDVIRMILVPSEKTVLEAHGPSISAALLRSSEAIATAFNSPVVSIPAPNQERLALRVREIVGGLQPGQRFAISRLSVLLGRPRRGALAEVLRDLESRRELDLKPPAPGDQIKSYRRAGGIQDPVRGDLVFVARVEKTES